MLSASLNCSAYPLHILSSPQIRFYTNILTTTLYIVQKNLFCKFLNIPKYHNSPVPKKSHREHAVTFLTQPGESARLITFHTKKPCAPKKSARGVQRGRCSSVPFGIFLPFIKTLNFFMTRNPKSCHSS